MVNGDLRLNEFKSFYLQYKDYSDLITFSVSPHSMYTCSFEYLKKCKALADKYNLPFNIHFCENTNEVLDITNTYNLTPIKALEKLNLFDNHLILGHGIYVDEYMKLKNIKGGVVHNPVSNLRLGCGILNICKYIKNDILVALGTDGQGSCR